MRIVRKILAAPLKLALQICAFFPNIDKLGMVKIIWNIAREPNYAMSYIFLTSQKEGIESARETGDKIFKEYPSDLVAGMMGMIEFNQNNFNIAKEWLEKGRRCPEKNPVSLLYLELELSDVLDEYDIETVITKILSRRDLSMDFTKRALATQAELFLRPAGQENTPSSRVQNHPRIGLLDRIYLRRYKYATFSSVLFAL